MPPKGNVSAAGPGVGNVTKPDFWLSVDEISNCVYDSDSDSWWQTFPLPQFESVSIKFTLHNESIKTRIGKIVAFIDGTFPLQITPSCTIVELPPNSNPVGNLWFFGANPGSHKITIKYQVFDHFESGTLIVDSERTTPLLSKTISFPVRKTLAELEIAYEVPEVCNCDNSSRIKHFFVLMLENRSFDHMFGFSDLKGKDAVTGIPTKANGLHPQTDGIHADESNNFLSTTFHAFNSNSRQQQNEFPFVFGPDAPHDFADVIAQLGGPEFLTHFTTDTPKEEKLKRFKDANGQFHYPFPENSGFVYSYWDRVVRPQDPKINDTNIPNQQPGDIMACFRPDQLPIIHTLAKEFAVCDSWFSSMPGPTWPNRFFVHAASSGGMDDNQTDEETIKAYHDSPIFDKAKTVAAALAIIGPIFGIPPEAAGSLAAAAGIGLSVYGAGFGYQFRNGTIFDRLDEKGLKWAVYGGDDFSQVWAIKDISKKKGRITPFSKFRDEVNDPNFRESYVFIEPRWSPIVDELSGGPQNSQHPPFDIRLGECLIKEVYETIRNSPHWEESALIITYDEHGGFYDHEAPPVAPAPNDNFPDGTNTNSFDNFYGFDFTRYGVRVPAIVISPLIPKGTIDHTLFDHTSILATLEKRFSMQPLTARDAAANPLNHLFSLSEPRNDTPTDLGPCGGQRHGDENVQVRRFEIKEVRGRKMDTMEWGFVRIALFRDLLISPKEQWDGIIQTFLKIKDKLDAYNYARTVLRKLKRLEKRKPKRLSNQKPRRVPVRGAARAGSKPRRPR